MDGVPFMISEKFACAPEGVSCLRSSRVHSWSVRGEWSQGVDTKCLLLGADLWEPIPC